MTTETVTAEAGRDFIRDIVQADLDSKKARGDRHPVSAGAERLSAHRPRQVDRAQFRHRAGIRRAVQSALRRHQPDQGRAGIYRFDPGRRALARLRLGQEPVFASDYFEQLYQWAEGLIKAGHAYVDDQTQEEIRVSRGTLTEPGKNSPFRDRSVEENLDLFRRMKAGEFPNGTRVLRAKIDMAAGNINLRDPVLYRILHAHHPRTGDTWSIYPSYDYAHGQSDAIEGITHSICTLEFEDHRPLYDWFLEKLPVPSKPRQYEFARLNLTYTLLSKRVLTQLVREGHVSGWDDPRMPTIAGPEAARRAAGGDPRIRQAHRRRQGQQRGRCRHAGVLASANSSTRPRSAGWRCCGRSRS